MESNKKRRGGSIMYTQNAYRCSYCHKYGLSKSNIKKHEERCFKNPVTRSCATCANFFTCDYSEDTETKPAKCLAGVIFEEKPNPSSVYRSLKLETFCGKWVEKPEDEEELIRYQDAKKQASADIGTPISTSKFLYESPF